MSKFESYSALIECPKCKQSGQAEFREPANPVYHGEDSQVVSVPEGFSRDKSGAIVCKCGAIARAAS